MAGGGVTGRERGGKTPDNKHKQGGGRGGGGAFFLGGNTKKDRALRGRQVGRARKRPGCKSSVSVS